MCIVEASGPLQAHYRPEFFALGRGWTRQNRPISVIFSHHIQKNAIIDVSIKNPTSASKTLLDKISNLHHPFPGDFVWTTVEVFWFGRGWTRFGRRFADGKQTVAGKRKKSEGRKKPKKEQKNTSAQHPTASKGLSQTLCRAHSGLQKR